jgi:hypothetical protein
MKGIKIEQQKRSRGWRWINGLLALGLLCCLWAGQAPQPTLAATLLDANFNIDENGFLYQDDAFGTSQPTYASGARSATGGYGGTGGLQITLGGVDAAAITGMSGAWTYTLNLGAVESGVKLTFRYKLDQGAFYEFDEYSRVLVKLDGTQYGRGGKTYVDHIGGDGATPTGSTEQGNSRTYVVTTDWQKVEIYLGDLAAGSHSLVLGAFNNKKDASDETTTLVIDDVQLSSGNPALAASAAQTLVNRVSYDQFLANIQGVAQFHDRCRGANNCTSTDYTTNYMNALTWVESQLQGMGYTTVRHTFTSNTSGTNLYATKMGSVTPTEMYIVSTHLDARSGGDGFDDDGSGVGLVMEIARILSAADVTTDKSVRFIFWDKEEIGLYGATAYASNDTASGGRRALQGTVDEPTWLGIIQHDMILYDHGAGSVTTNQSAYADLDVEWRSGSTQEAASKALALKWRFLAGNYAPDYPANAYNYSTNTDDTPFQPYVASISVRENRRSLTSNGNAEWINPYYHTVNDKEVSYTRDDDGDGVRDDIELGVNAIKATLGLVAELAGAHVGTVNNPPVAYAQSVSTLKDVPVDIILSGSDPDGNPLTFSVVASPSHGTLTGTPPNVTYTPASGYTGADSFTFTVNDGTVDSAPATVSINVMAPNVAPVANAQSITTNEDTAKGIVLSGSDANGDPLTYQVTAGPTHGSLSGSAPNLTYTPAMNYNGSDSFNFRVNDGQENSAPAAVSITVLAVNDAPAAAAQSFNTSCNTPKAITLAGSDVDGDSLTFLVGTGPTHGSLAGTAPALTYTPALGYSGVDSFTFTVYDGQLSSAPASISLSIGACSALFLPYLENFENGSGGGWIANPEGTDSAGRGKWERADPQPTDLDGPRQLDDAASGSFALVTGAAAGNDAGANDVDGGLTSMRSPDLQLPSGQDITFSIKYYFAHARNASMDDFLRLKVVGESTQAVLNLQGSNKDVDATWKTFSASLNPFAGQTVYLLLEAADLSRESLVEAALDDVSITAVASAAPVLSASFDGNAGAFTYLDDAFRGTGQPDYASGSYQADGGLNGGGLQVRLGGIDDYIVQGISGGWQTSFSLSTPTSVIVSFWYRLVQSPEYEGNEISQALLSVDGVLYGSGANDCILQVKGNGNGGGEEATGWEYFSVDLGTLAAGSHTMNLGGYNNRKSMQNEWTEIWLDQVVVYASP